MLPATKDQCSIRISELLNSFQPWCYYLIWGRVTTCLPPLSLQMFRPLPGLIHFMMASKCQSISLVVVASMFSQALRVAEGYTCTLTHRLDLLGFRWLISSTPAPP